MGKIVARFVAFFRIYLVKKHQLLFLIKGQILFNVKTNTFLTFFAELIYDISVMFFRGLPFSLFHLSPPWHFCYFVGRRLRRTDGQKGRRGSEAMEKVAERPTSNSPPVVFQSLLLLSFSVARKGEKTVWRRRRRREWKSRSLPPHALSPRKIAVDGFRLPPPPS